MKTILSLSVPVFTLGLLVGCSSGGDSKATGPIIDELDVPPTTHTMSLQGQSGPGVILTLTAHDDTAGIDALHIRFTEIGAERTIPIPSAPTKLTSQSIELVVLDAPKGVHAVEFHLTDAKGRSSAVVDKTITVP